MPAIRVLFLCTHTSARSQMAEGLLRTLAGDRVEVHSAGTIATAVRPEAITVMDEIGINLRDHTSKTLARFVRQPFDFVITVCDDANKACPVFPRAQERLHWSINDPIRAQGTEADRLQAFRKARDVLPLRIEQELLPQILAASA
ncbi:MAG: arsenate reductase ArsC [Chloroflexota bacterium]